MLIIGIGNVDRGDDAAGLLVVRRLRQMGIEACEHSGDPIALVESWPGESEVHLVDAVVTGAPPGTVYEWESDLLPPEAVGLRASTHSLRLSDSLALAKATGRTPRRLVVYGIEAVRFEPGSSPSGTVLRSVEQVSELLRCKATAFDLQRQTHDSC